MRLCEQLISIVGAQPFCIATGAQVKLYLAVT